jgi:hypothetical protein
MASVLNKIACVATLLAICGPWSAALAAEDPEALIRQGIALRKEGQDARAEGYFRRAYQLAATPRTAAQLGLAELAVDDYFNAEAHLSEALDSRDAWILEHLAVLKDSRDLARRNLWHVEMVGGPPNITVTLDGSLPRPLAPGGFVWLDPGRSATLRIEAPGYQPAVLRVSGATGEGRRITLAMQPLEQAPVVASRLAPGPATVEQSPAQRPASGALRIAGAATTAIGVASSVLGVVLYEQGSAKLRDYQAAIRSDGKVPWNPADEDWETKHNWGVGFLIAGGMTAAGGVALFLVGQHTDHARTEGGDLSFVAGSGFGLLSYRGSF